MKQEIVAFVARCDNCCRVKAVHMKAGLLQPLSIPGWKWEEVSMDFIVGLPTSVKGYDSIWVIVDRLTKLLDLFQFELTIVHINMRNCTSSTLSVSMVCLELLYQIMDHSSLLVFGSVCMSRLVLIWSVVRHITPKQQVKLNVLTKS